MISYVDLPSGYYLFEGVTAKRISNNLLKLRMLVLNCDLISTQGNASAGSNLGRSFDYDIDIFSSREIFKPVLNYNNVTNINDFLRIFKGERFIVFIDEKGKMVVIQYFDKEFK